MTTAGNASGINDGAAALIVASRDAGDKAGVKPLARVSPPAVAGVPPRIMGFGPVPAAKKALERAGLDAQGHGRDRDQRGVRGPGAGLPQGPRPRRSTTCRVNPNGGAIAVGHPLGASGARLALTAARQLQRTGGRYALVSMCIGVGQGIAVILERM